MSRLAAAALVVTELGIPRVTDCHASFTDVPCNHPGYGAIQALADLGVTGNGMFTPDGDITRAQFASFMAFGFCLSTGNPPGCLVTPATPTWSDVGSGHAFYRVVESSRAHGWTVGDADGPTFNPDGTMTRAATATWLWAHLRAKHGL